MCKMQIWVCLIMFLLTLAQNEGQNVDKVFAVPIFANYTTNNNSTNPFTTALFKGTFLNLFDLAFNGKLMIINLSFYNNLF